MVEVSEIGALAQAVGAHWARQETERVEAGNTAVYYRGQQCAVLNVPRSMHSVLQHVDQLSAFSTLGA
jgi:hypothetical protein